MKLKSLLGSALIAGVILVGWAFGESVGYAARTTSPTTVIYSETIAPPVTSTSKLYQSSAYLEVDVEELLCLAKTIYFEARGEPFVGQVAVARVVINRVRDPDYPDTICRVVTQGRYASWRNKAPEEIAQEPMHYPAQGPGCQFSWYCDGRSDKPIYDATWTAAVQLAYRVIAENAWDGIIEGATHYHTIHISPYWNKNLTQVSQIAEHVFFRKGESL